MPEAVPVIQGQLINMSKKLSKPVIIATQMLYSLTSNTEPTRAEVSDIANAVMQGVDCLMLSDETASGNNPIEAMQVMKRVILYTEVHATLAPSIVLADDYSKQEAISLAIIKLAESVNANAIVAETKSGATAKHIAAKHTQVPLFAVTNIVKTAQQLAIVYGVKSYVRPVNKQAAQKLTDWLWQQKILNKGDIVVTASGRYPGVVGTTDTIKVRILT
jgi:pyruvate kinase